MAEESKILTNAREHLTQLRQHCFQARILAGNGELGEARIKLNTADKIHYKIYDLLKLPKRYISKDTTNQLRLINASALEAYELADFELNERGAKK